MLKTENLVILFTDIVGYTEFTSKQSRAQNQRIVDRHNDALFPVVKKFRGKLVKCIGDAMLITFSSPTDAMRCAMAMQDAIHELNLGAANKDDEIHIRIAASLGEVRITKNDVFGEAVNLTSRIESITPPDEIYFSEAVYLAMNKAEVPAVEIGMQELKGIPQPIRIFGIPRFAESRLVSEVNQTEENDPRISYPHGGMHLSASPVGATWIDRVAVEGRRMIPCRRNQMLGGTALLAIAVLALVALVLSNTPTPFAKQQTPSTEIPAVVVEKPAPVKLAAILPPGVDRPPLLPPPQLTADAKMPSPSSISNSKTETTESNFAPKQISNTSPKEPPLEALPSPTKVTPVRQVAAAVAKKAPVQPKLPVATRSPSISSIADAKRAYNQKRIDKVRYREVVRNLKINYSNNVRQAKLDYRAGKLNKQQYRDRIVALKKSYEGVR